MNIKRRSAHMLKEVGSKPKNAVSQRVDAMTEASKIRNTVSTPKNTGVTKMINATSGPK